MTIVERPDAGTDQHPAARVPSHRAENLATLAAGVGFGITMGLVVPALSQMSLSQPGALANALGIVTAMAGTYAALLSMLLMARIPWVEHEVGQDRLTAWHRALGPWTLILIVGHVVFTTIGYAQASGVGPVSELVSLTFGFGWMLPAMAATILMVGLGVVAWRPIRRRMSYDTWHIAHMYFYLAVALAFGHQITTGSVFVGHRFATAWWVGLYVLVFGLIIGYRFLMPLVQSLRHDLRVAAVEPVDADTVHVHLVGRRLEALEAQGGQWFSWRFGNRRWWWQGHPYSLSAAPTSARMRITVRNLGDQSGALGTLKPGTRVFAEGPYGAFRADRRHTDRVVAIGAGIGIGPIRALVEELPATVSVDVLYRAHSTPAPLADELQALAEGRGGRIRVFLLAGTRQQYPMTAHLLNHFVPDVASGDVYVCGPAGFLEAAREACATAGVPADRIHDELFEF
jgi:predicted ferric reductase